MRFWIWHFQPFTLGDIHHTGGVLGPGCCWCPWAASPGAACRIWRHFGARTSIGLVVSSLSGPCFLTSAATCFWNKLQARGWGLGSGRQDGHRKKRSKGTNSACFMQMKGKPYGPSSGKCAPSGKPFRMWGCLSWSNVGLKVWWAGHFLHCM